jgi:anti-sigma regulatory factor (Ser/Thr protein kinase)
MREARTFPHAVTSVSQARRYVTTTLADVPAELVDSVALMVSELATNACKHANTDFVVTIEQVGRQIRIEVTDGGSGEPRPRTPAHDELSGRGLRIVEALSDDWGVIPAEGAGKTVWFSVNAGDQPTVAAS